MDGLHREQFELAAAGRRLQAERLRPANAAAGPWLVFLHEGLGSIAQWKDFPAALCAELGLPGLVYERWGFGRSEPLDGPRTSRYLHDEALCSLPDVLLACGIDDYVLVGHSDGGSIALIHAAAYPEGPRAAVTEAAHVFVEDVTLAGIRAAVEAWHGAGLRGRLARYHGAQVESTFAGWADTWLSEAFREWNIEAELPGIRCPLLVIQGEGDEYGTLAQVEAIARTVSGPAETLLIPGCGHVPHFQAREAVLAATADFVRRVL